MTPFKIATLQLVLALGALIVIGANPNTLIDVIMGVVLFVAGGQFLAQMVRFQQERDADTTPKL